MSSPPSSAHWLDRYGNAEAYRWRRVQITGRDAYQRPLGLVEFSFDTDGRHFEGRADMNALLELSVRTHLHGHEFRERILIAWTLLRCQHLLIRARSTCDKSQSVAPQGLHFAVDVYESVGKAIEDAGSQLVFLEDYYQHVDEKDFYLHCQNVRRIIDPDAALTKAFVLPFKRDEQGRGILRIMFIIAHQTADGLSSYVWLRDMVKSLNQPEQIIREQIARCIAPEFMENHLPPPQEALYPPIPGNTARRRWFWAITRILRHVRKQLPVGFSNPYRRAQPLSSGQSFAPVYSRVLDYHSPPLLNSHSVWLHVSTSSTKRLRSLCKEVNASLGAGIHALSALVAMEFHEEREPDVALRDRKHFITGFPLDPRAFFGFHTDPDSMMLAFSDGISLPFLPSSLSLEGRLKLLARQAQRQLASYQKRAKPKGGDAKTQFLTSRGTGLVLANQYLYSLERADSCIPGQRSLSVNSQGAYLPRSNPIMQTHGVSSVGNREALIRSGMFEIDDSSDFTADLLELSQSVRPRQGEFLLGIGGTKDGLFSTPSIDATNLDPVLVNRWRDRFETILDEPGDRNDRAKL